MTAVIPISKLREGMKVAEPVLSNTGAHRNMIICRTDSFLTARTINLLRRHEVKKVEIYAEYADPSDFDTDPDDDTEADKESVFKDLPQIEPILTPYFKERAIVNIKNLFNAISIPNDSITLTTSHKLVQEFEKTLSHVVGAAASNREDMIHIYDLKTHDEYTFHHSVSVALLAVSTGQSLGFELRELMSLGRSALFHDIGKQYVPSEIINKTGRLSKEELDEMRSHPPVGAANVKAKGLSSTVVSNGILFHHEKVDGTGYPRGLAGNEIPLEAKIIAVADVFDALTSYRSYRKPMTPTAAYELIMKEVGTSFDYTIVEAFLKKLVFYPVNSLIELSSGQIVSVAENQNVLRPVVVDITTKEKFDLSSPKNSDIMIDRVIDALNYP